VSAPAFSKTNQDSGSRAYDMHGLDPARCPEGTWYRSVTSSLKAVNKPALINWAGKVNREAIYRHIEAHPSLSLAQRRGVTDIPHHNIESKGAADVGTLVHAYAESVFSGQPFSTAALALGDKNRGEYARAVDGLEAWLKGNTVEPIWTERTLWLHPGEFHPTLGVCGTFDLAAKINGETLLVDIKTSAEVYPEHWLQVETGSNAWDTRDGYIEGVVPRHTAILTVGKNGTTKLTRCKDVGCKHADWADAMLACMTLAEYLYGEAGA
jgi:hypothetical protein